MQTRVFSLLASAMLLTTSSYSTPSNIKSVERVPDISIAPIDINSELPALRDPIVSVNNDNWLVIGGALGRVHDFKSANLNLYVYNPDSKKLFTMPMDQTNLPTEVKTQIASNIPESFQDGSTLYIVGGFKTVSEPVTINTISSIDVPAMINAIMSNDKNLAPYVHYNESISQFKVTGGQLNKINDSFYLVYGHDCNGTYCSTSQVYTNSIYKFKTDPTLSSLQILDTVTHDELDGSGWRRRDYSLAPFKLGNTDTLLALGGPFTPGGKDDRFAWTNGILFDENLQANSNFINQHGNQYMAPVLSMYDAQKQTSYVASFGGLGNLYWSKTGELVSDNSTPYGNVLDLITSDAAGNTQEYVNLQPLCSGLPLSSCQYMGLGSVFIPIERYYDKRHILQLNQLPASGKTKTLIGYVYSGIITQSQGPLRDPTSRVSNTVYGVYVHPSSFSTENWENVTNLAPKESDVKSLNVGN